MNSQFFSKCALESLFICMGIYKSLQQLNLTRVKLYFSIKSSNKTFHQVGFLLGPFSWDILSRNSWLRVEFRRFSVTQLLLYWLTLWLIFITALIVACREAIRALRRASAFLAFSTTLRSLKLLAVALLVLSCSRCSYLR